MMFCLGMTLIVLSPVRREKAKNATTMEPSAIALPQKTTTKISFPQQGVSNNE
jgi:hypothetical protein